METKKLSPKDASLLRNHPNATPEQLLALGLSKKGYEKLEAATAPRIQPVSVEQAEAAPAKPATVTPKLVKLQNLNTGLVVVLSYKTATMLSTNYPNSYKTLP
ncbi:MAG: hypothetical protein EOP51_04035 [Sphingobacteriales bacterium]|nr:MAG: hypothetical protein EOP51_04035 [Sphingobacteriales bacterium]